MLRYAQWSVEAKPAFMARLAHLKLTVWGLSQALRPCTAHLQHGRLTLDAASLDGEGCVGSDAIAGVVWPVNVKEDFEDADGPCVELLEVCAAASLGAAAPAFFMAVFVDYKESVVRHWLAFPVLVLAEDGVAADVFRPRLQRQYEPLSSDSATALLCAMATACGTAARVCALVPAAALTGVELSLPSSNDVPHVSSFRATPLEAAFAATAPGDSVLLCVRDGLAVNRSSSQAVGWPVRAAVTRFCLARNALSRGSPQEKLTVVVLREDAGCADSAAAFVLTASTTPPAPAMLELLHEWWRGVAPPAPLPAGFASAGRETGSAAHHEALVRTTPCGQPVLRSASIASSGGDGDGGGGGVERDAQDLNLSLMRWRLVPELDIARLRSTRVLLIGMGTLGCNVARTLLGWGVTRFTLVDSGRVSLSSPSRQPLFTAADATGRLYKVDAAAAALRGAHPGMEVAGHVLHVPSPGHAASSPAQCKSVLADVARLNELIEVHDAVFLLTDTRESRWLPALLAARAGALCISVGLSFEELVVIRHGVRVSRRPPPGDAARAFDTPTLGNADVPAAAACYFCVSDASAAPRNSMLRRPLDVACAVTRPGLAPIAAGLAAELLVAMLHHPLGAAAPHEGSDDHRGPSGGTASGNPLGPLFHVLRFRLPCTMTTGTSPATDTCTACSPRVLEAFKERGAAFVLDVVNDAGVLEAVAGLRAFRDETEALLSHVARSPGGGVDTGKAEEVGGDDDSANDAAWCEL